ncbi:MAG: bifunctional diguanylate cyclase/phosphodiesterase [Mycobacterium sp.]|nr:bifunctional diguanylate cyclase/phosphodiesterase [Mycobacterium sp.]
MSVRARSAPGHGSGGVPGRVRCRGARPTIATPRLVAVTNGVSFVLAGVLVAAATYVTPAGFERVGLLRLLAVGALGSGAAVVLLRNRLPAVAPHVLLLVGTALVTLAVYLGGSSPAAVSLAALYVLLGVDCAFFAWRTALAHLAVTVAACAAALWRGSPVGTGAFLLVGGVTVVMAGLVAALVRVAEAAESDALTGLPNRRGLDRFLDGAVAAAQRAGVPLSLAVVDLDHFKAVNDGSGHDAGDRLLADAARAWKAVLGPGSLLARLGGDEFVVALPGWPIDDAVALVERLRVATPEGRTCSAGVAEWAPGESASLLLSSADGALYQAKRAGRDCVRHHGGAGAAAAQVRRALDREELVVHYQPVVELQTGVVVGTEALVRWQHPQRGLLPPAALLPLVEEAGRLADLGHYVLERACRQTARWRQTGGPAEVAVNVAVQELLDPAFVPRLREVLRDSGLPAEALVLEVTESSFAEDATQVLRSLEQARELGVRVAVDDFGTGYSSLSRLRRIPADILKVDRSFVQDLAVDPGALPIVRVILALAAALGLRVIAEGVEEPHQARLLADLGCEYAQGFLYGRPVPPEQVPGGVAPGVPAPRASADAPAGGGDRTRAGGPAG